MVSEPYYFAVNASISKLVLSYVNPTIRQSPPCQKGEYHIKLSMPDNNIKENLFKCAGQHTLTLCWFFYFTENKLTFWRNIFADRFQEMDKKKFGNLKGPAPKKAK